MPFDNCIRNNMYEKPSLLQYFINLGKRDSVITLYIDIYHSNNKLFYLFN